MTTRSSRSVQPQPEEQGVNLHALGARVVGMYVFGKFQRVLIEMRAEDAQPFFPESFERSGHTALVESVEHEIALIRGRDKNVADTALAASAVALAREIENPFNSATSKSMCAREMRETLGALRELAPAERKKDFVDNIQADVAKARAKRAKKTVKPVKPVKGSTKAAGKPRLRRTASKAKQSS